MLPGSGKQAHAAFASLQIQIHLSAIHQHWWPMLCISQKLENHSTIVSHWNNLTGSLTVQWQWAYANHTPLPITTSHQVQLLSQLPPCLLRIISVQLVTGAWGHKVLFRGASEYYLLWQVLYMECVSSCWIPEWGIPSRGRCTPTVHSRSMRSTT